MWELYNTVNGEKKQNSGCASREAHTVTKIQKNTAKNTIFWGEIKLPHSLGLMANKSEHI